MFSVLCSTSLVFLNAFLKRTLNVRSSYLMRVFSHVRRGDIANLISRIVYYLLVLLSRPLPIVIPWHAPEPECRASSMVSRSCGIIGAPVAFLLRVVANAFLAV